MAYHTMQFAELEREHKLFSLTYHGVPYWQLLRHPISECCLHHADKVETVLPRHTEKTRFAKMFFAAVRETVRQNARLHSLRHAEVLLFRTEGERRIGDETVNPLFDCIDYTGLTTQSVWDTQEFLKLPAAARYTIAPAVLRGYLYKLWYRFTRKWTRDKAAYAQLQSTVALVNRTFGTQITQAEVIGYENEILYLISAHKGFVPYFKKLLRRVQPKVIVMNCYYMVPSLMMIQAARELGIQTVELQHGHIYNHISYCFADKTPQGKLVPDVFFAFNRFFANACTLTDATRIVVTGYPFLERSLAHYDRAPLDDKTVVFYSQVSLGHKLTKFMLDFAALAAPHGYHVVCKLHPAECADWRTMYPELITAQIDAVDDDRSTNVYAYVATHRYQVVADSTTAFEIAAVPGARLYIPLSCPHGNTQPMLELGFAQGVENPAALLAAILADASGAPSAAASERNAAVEPFWPTGAAQNVGNALRALVSAEL
ncbi:MAG: hypothetical protein RR194_02055 [Ruthenibacterium sp.]